MNAFLEPQAPSISDSDPLAISNSDPLAPSSSSQLAEGSQPSGKIDLLNFDRQELAEELQARLGFESYRSKQLVAWLYRHRATSFEVMTNISKQARAALAEHFTISRPTAVQVQQSRDGTRKYLFQLDDGNMVESVLIKQTARYTLCVSSQVGCAIGCRFCRTAQMGLVRHLKTAEIIGQVLAVKDDIAGLPLDQDGLKVDFTNIVFMGMGEPLHNVDNVIRTVRLLNDELGLDFSSRKITVSTSGLVPAIRKLGASGAGANLAVSLNATTNEVRTRIMPITKRWPLESLLEALREYPLKRGKRITIEYVMLAGVTDTVDDLRRLPQLLTGIPVKVNLIPYNANAGLGFDAPRRDWVFHWQESLLDAGLNSTIRWSKGDDIDAACGQLATVYEKTKRREKAERQQPQGGIGTPERTIAEAS
ncbi:MAG: 23S rRNA (adenine(2503)-C(2))-methyltransferase RlmN [Bdellovibrionales bacterium]|nr:23S rRNA (adenine(2503)-C(2))-methyltransferase RlmN [Bdellovibrionales bacterium]